MKQTALIAVALGLIGSMQAEAQVLPQLPRASGVVDHVIGELPDADTALGEALSLVRAQTARVRDLVRQHPDRVAIDPDGNAVRANELIVLDADHAVTQAATARGFRLIERVELDGLGIAYARFATPRGMKLVSALKQLRGVAGGRVVSADPLYFASGELGPQPGDATGRIGAIDGDVPWASGSKGRIGIIDGGVPPGTPGLARQQGFAPGGPRPNDHATAIASLLTGGGDVRASAPGARLHVADVYGADPAGGNATAIGQALAWTVRARVPVVVVSLAGPSNPLLGRVVAAARRLGTVIVAAVGNDGPAAKPAFPASYPDAIAVTGVDARGRVLIEAGRAARLDYAAPGADLLGLGADGTARRLRGTSFAAPFVAARLSAQLGAGGITEALMALDLEAKGRGGLGRGMLCGDCATRPR